MTRCPTCTAPEGRPCRASEHLFPIDTVRWARRKHRAWRYRHHKNRAIEMQALWTKELLR